MLQDSMTLDSFQMVANLSPSCSSQQAVLLDLNAKVNCAHFACTVHHILYNQNLTNLVKPILPFRGPHLDSFA